MWPFKKRPKQTMEEFAAEQPPAPCGQQTKHWYWEKFGGMPCPVCAGDRKRAEKRAEQERLSQLIADAVIAKLKGGA